MPSTAYDAKGLLKSAIRDDNPVLILEKRMLYSRKSAVPTEEYVVPIGVADVKREGSDVTVVAAGASTHLALQAARQLAREGLELEVVDPRTLKPLDIETIVDSVKKTGRCVIAHEATRTCGFGAELAALVQEHCFYHLEAPIVRVTGWDTPYPHALEWAYFPGPQRVADGMRRALEG